MQVYRLYGKIPAGEWVTLAESGWNKRDALGMLILKFGRQRRFVDFKTLMVDVLACEGCVDESFYRDFAPAA
jgi:hypothetical protein